MTDTKPRRRVIIPKQKEPTKDLLNKSTVVPTADQLVHDSMVVIGTELAQYRRKTARGITLDLKEARIVQGYVDVLIKLSKEAREAARQHDMSDMSNEELLQLATQLLSGNNKEVVED